MKVKDPIVANIEDAQETVETFLNETKQENEDLRNFMKDLSRTAAMPDKSFVDSFNEHYFRDHSDVYETDDPKEALISELGQELDFLDDNQVSSRAAMKVGSKLNKTIEEMEESYEDLEHTLELFNGLRYAVDEEFREKNDLEEEEWPRFYVEKEGEKEEFRKQVFEEDVSKNPSQLERIGEHIENLDEAENYLDDIAIGIQESSKKENNDGLLEYLYEKQKFTRPILNGVVTSLRAIREEKEKTGQYLANGTEHDYVLERWAEHLGRQTEGTEWRILGTEIDYLSEHGGETNGEFDILLGSSEELVYLEVKPDLDKQEVAYKQIEDAVDADEITGITDKGYMELKDEEMKGYVVQGLPDYTEDTIKLLEESENKAIFSR